MIEAQPATDTSLGHTFGPAQHICAPRRIQGDSGPLGVDNLAEGVQNALNGFQLSFQRHPSGVSDRERQRQNQNQN